ncbi:uncharacterized protein [Drosophila bipectinata]|uniref:uncharacterized protein n=1 Tax=Drosophila bipectinata TaxID=42026 RepID=UPI001C89FFD8|nr:uncharacterized protein LOC108131445 [Drosophila bipectinata]
MALTLPPEDAHWSLRFEDIGKSYPNQTTANATYKVISFLYPPFAQEALKITHKVSSPELCPSFVGACLAVLFLTSASLVGYMHMKKPKPVVKKPSEALVQLERRMEMKYGSQYKQGIWERQDIPDPILPKKRSVGLLHDSNAQLVQEPLNDFVEAHWMPASVTNLLEDERPRSPSNRAVKSNKGVKKRVFEPKCGMHYGDGYPVNLVKRIQLSDTEDSSDDRQQGRN